MTDEQVKAIKKYAGEKKASMKRRDDHHDYKERCIYMLTLEVEGRRPVFGRLVGDPFAKRGSHNEPRIELSELGKAVQAEWLGISRYYPQIKVLVVQMMPDHMHGILMPASPPSSLWRTASHHCPSHKENSLMLAPKADC